MIKIFDLAGSLGTRVSSLNHVAASAYKQAQPAIVREMSELRKEG
jgi:hypothetical protein